VVVFPALIAGDGRALGIAAALFQMGKFQELRGDFRVETTPFAIFLPEILSDPKFFIEPSQ